MDRANYDLDVAAILARLDRSTSDSLLSSFAAELLCLHNALSNMHARVTALEVSATLKDNVANVNNRHASDDLPRSITIEASFALPAEAGFYWLEYDNNGRPYRWTGPEPLFFFELFINRRYPLDMRLRYSKLQEPGDGKLIRCYVDGKELESELTEIDGEFEVSAVIPERDLLGGTIVMFECANVQSPSEKGNSDDSRKLGLSFRWLKIDGDRYYTSADAQASNARLRRNGTVSVDADGKDKNRHVSEGASVSVI